MSTHEYPKEMINPGADAPAAPERLRSFVERMEWSGWGYDQAGEGKPKCPDCGNWQDEGHAEGCGLAALLAVPVAPADYPECSGDSSCCPENEGFGCCKTSGADSACSEPDGCPTELSVLKRFWRGQPIPDEHKPAWFIATASAGDKQATSEPVAWRLGHRFYSDKGEAEFDWRNDGVFDNTGYCPEPLYTTPPDVQRDAERLHRLRGWLVRHGLLHALFCQPEAGMKAGDFWVLRKPYMVNGDGCEGYGKTEEEAIDAAMAAKVPT